MQVLLAWHTRHRCINNEALLLPAVVAAQAEAVHLNHSVSKQSSCAIVHLSALSRWVREHAAILVGEGDAIPLKDLKLQAALEACVQRIAAHVMLP